MICRRARPRYRNLQVGAAVVPAAIPGLWHGCREQPRRDPKTPPLQRRVGVDFAGAVSDVQTLVGAAVPAAIPRSMHGCHEQPRRDPQVYAWMP